jgi:AraC-like DNA-binding protein
VTARNLRRKKRPAKADRNRFEGVIEIYLEHCYEVRSVARVSELAERLERNRPTLSRRSSEIFGKPLGAVLREHQLAYAAELLKTSPVTVDEIAAEAGFGHRTSFYRQFKRRFGCTPARFREATKCY